MAQADAQVIVPRRNFLIRALGFTAAGGAMALPLITVADARARASHHLTELHKALQDSSQARRLLCVTDSQKGKMPTRAV
jgi:hypothetical protein